MTIRAALLSGVVLLASAFASSAQGPAVKPVDQQVAELIASMEKSDVAGMQAADKLVAIGKPAVGQLITGFKSPVPRVKWWCVAAAARIGDESAYAPILEMAKSEQNLTVRATALWYLQHYPRQEVWDLAVKTLDDPAREMRGWAIKLLREKNRVESAPKLEEVAAKSPDYQTRYDAMAAVVALKDAESVEFLCKMVRGDPHEAVREGALRCVTTLKKKPAAALSVLIDGMEDKNNEVRTAAATLLLKGTTVDFHFNPGGDSEIRAAAVRAWREWFEKNKAHIAWDDTRKRFEVQPAK